MDIPIEAFTNGDPPIMICHPTKGPQINGPAMFFAVLDCMFAAHQAGKECDKAFMEEWLISKANKADTDK